MTDGTAPRVIKAKVTNDVVDYPHNELANAAWFFRERLKTAISANTQSEGIFLDMMALVTMTAFSLEGYINFVGHHVLARAADEAIAKLAWAEFERRSVRDKIKALKNLIGLDIDWDTRPYATIKNLVHLRNLFAHPKAHQAKEREWIQVGTQHEMMEMLRNHRPEYEKLLTWEFANDAYEDAEQIWKGLLTAANIEMHETFSGGSQGIEFIEEVMV
jgi:hypothetical protein